MSVVEELRGIESGKGLAAPWRELVERVVAEYREALKDDLLAVACFGSVARGNPSPDSDLDLYVVTRNEVTILSDLRLGGMSRIRETSEYRTVARHGYSPDLMPMFHSISRLATHPWILLDIADHGVILYDPKGILRRELDVVRLRLRELGSQRIERPDGSWYWDLKPDWHPGEVFSL
jgi:predicted nucleotidyltransferase